MEYHIENGADLPVIKNGRTLGVLLEAHDFEAPKAGFEVGFLSEFLKERELGKFFIQEMEVPLGPQLGRLL